MKKRAVAVFGLGAVGGVAFSQLARLGVGTLVGVDPDNYDKDSWLTQPALPIHRGQPKARLQGEAAHRLNEQIDVLAGLGFAQDVPLGLLRRMDLFLVAGDNLELLVWAGNLGAALGKIVLQGAIHPETATCFVRAFDRRASEAVCPGCLLGPGEWNGLRNRAGCDLKTLRLQGERPTRTVPTVCGAAGQLLAHEALRRLVEDESRQVLCNEELALSLTGYRLLRTELPRNPHCRCPHQSWQLIDLSQPATEVTLATLLDKLAVGQDFGHVQVRSDLPWVQAAQCEKCGRLQPAARFARLGQALSRCGCGSVTRAVRGGIRSVVPAGELKQYFDGPLSELGLGPGSTLGLATEAGWTYFFLPCRRLDRLANATVPSRPKPFFAS